MNTLMNCGCVVKVYDDGSGVDIEYCNMHWKAPERLAALKVLLEEVSKKTYSQRMREDAISRARAAIANAEGK